MLGVDSRAGSAATGQSGRPKNQDMETKIRPTSFEAEQIEVMHQKYSIDVKSVKVFNTAKRKFSVQFSVLKLCIGLSVM